MSESVSSYHDLIAWQKAMDLVVSVYRATKILPDNERFGLIAQMRRCAVSIPSNIAEGWGRGDSQDFTRFLTIGRGSLFELSTQVEVCQRLKFRGEWGALLNQADEVGRILQGLIKSRTDRNR